MIDPLRITNFHRTREELEEFWIFCIMVAGKPAQRTAKLLHDMLGGVSAFGLFRHLARDGNLDGVLRFNRVGQYRRIGRAINESLDLNLRTCTLDALESVYGVGPKTARFFLLHSRPNQQLAVLDRHILAYLRSVGLDAPANTPGNPTVYRALEAEILARAQAMGVSPAEFDLALWSQRAAA